MSTIARSDCSCPPPSSTPLRVSCMDVRFCVSGMGAARTVPSIAAAVLYVRHCRHFLQCLCAFPVRAWPRPAQALAHLRRVDPEFSKHVKKLDYDLQQAVTNHSDSIRRQVESPVPVAASLSKPQWSSGALSSGSSTSASTVGGSGAFGVGYASGTSGGARTGRLSPSSATADSHDAVNRNQRSRMTSVSFDLDPDPGSESESSVDDGEWTVGVEEWVCHREASRERMGWRTEKNMARFTRGCILCTAPISLRACVRACVCACVRACVCACVCVCVRVCACVRASASASL